MKSEIFSIVQGLHVTPHYVVYEMALKAGHEVLGLPVAHCTLNPMELAWAQVKDHIKTNTCEFNLTEAEHLAHEGFEVVTPEYWASLVKHVRDKVDDHYWEVDGLAEHYSVWEFTFRIRRPPEDDPNEESSSEEDTDSDNDLMAGDESDFCMFYNSIFVSFILLLFVLYV